jgi:fructokinase
MVRYAAVEGGGTTWQCGLLENSIDQFLERVVIPTTTPEETLGKVKEWLLAKNVDAIGVASFGPIDAKKGSPTYGFITSTPKPGWRNTNVLQLIGAYDDFRGIPILFDTDVNAPALAEFTVQEEESKATGAPVPASSAYITIGTGIGVGLVINHGSVKGLLHPEAGHVLVQPRPGDESFPGTCPFHGRCVEGMCSNGAMSTRLGITHSQLPELPDDHEIWDICAYYIAQLCMNLVLIASPETIRIGGGVMKRTVLYEKTRKITLQLLNGYIVSPLLTGEGIDHFIGPSRWYVPPLPLGFSSVAFDVILVWWCLRLCCCRGDHAGIVGAAFLAKLAHDQQTAK